MDHKIYMAFFAPFTESLTTYHYNLPCHNLMCMEKLEEVSLNSYLHNEIDAPVELIDSFPFFQKFMYETDGCTVLYPGHCMVDRAYDLVLKKMLWKRRLISFAPKKYRAICSLKKNRLLKLHRIDKKTQLYLNLMKCDPAEGFVGDYNWLYTGGNIDGFNYSNHYWLMTPDENRRSTYLNMIQLNSSTFTPIWRKNMRPKTFELLENQPVHQIICKANVNGIFIAVRQMGSITIKKLIDDFVLSNVWNLTTHENKSYKDWLTTCDLSQDSRYLTAVNNECQMNVYNVELDTSIFSLIEEKDPVPWSKVLFNNESNKVYFANQYSFKIFDLRDNSQPSFVYKPITVTNQCEKITNFFGSEFRENIMYMVTSHNLIEVDIRNGKNIQKWTHMMKFAAQFGATRQTKDEELVILQSEDSRELVGMCNEGLLDNFPRSKSGPYLFSTLQQEVPNAHFNALGLHHKIGERIDFKITGLHFVRDSEGLNNIFTVNGGGDIIMSKLKNRKQDDPEGGRNYKISSNTALGLQNLERRCYRVQTKTKKTKSSTMYDVSRLLSAMKNPDSKILSHRKRLKPTSYYWPRHEVYSPESLCFFKGYLADSILPHWGIKMRGYGESSDEKEDENQRVELGKTKVIEWMKNL